MLSTPGFLKSIGAKYVACLKKTRVVKNVNTNIIRMIPQYSIVWTDMEIEDAPKEAMIKWYFLDGNSIHYDVMPLDAVIVVEKIEELPNIEKLLSL